MTTRSKQGVREEVWNTMIDAGVGRFPFPLKGRIPNFKGAEDAADRLAELDAWQRAEAIKANPDSPQRPVRQRALDEGKTVYMAVPRLRDERPFIELGSARIDDTRRASTIKGAFEIGRPVTLDDVPHIDLIVAVAVAVNRDGARVGKGGGYSDLEFGLGREASIIDADTVIVTTVHKLQVIDEELERLQHDIPVDFIITPDEVIETETKIPRPSGIYWEHLLEGKIDSIPILRRLRGKN